MLRNDYRRALILLRAVEPGLSGHVRLERRTLMASMHFLINGAPNSAEEMEAALVARTACGWKTAHIGALRRDSRGQAGLGWSFDPRSIDGLALEQYGLVVIFGTQACYCRLLMTGFLNGSVEVDWNRVREAVCASYGYVGDGSQTPQPREGEGDSESAEASGSAHGEAPLGADLRSPIAADTALAVASSGVETALDPDSVSPPSETEAGGAEAEPVFANDSANEDAAERAAPAIPQANPADQTPIPLYDPALPRGRALASSPNADGDMSAGTAEDIESGEDGADPSAYTRGVNADPFLDADAFDAPSNDVSMTSDASFSMRATLLADAPSAVLDGDLDAPAAQTLETVSDDSLDTPAAQTLASVSDGDLDAPAGRNQASLEAEPFDAPSASPSEPFDMPAAVAFDPFDVPASRVFQETASSSTLDMDAPASTGDLLTVSTAREGTALALLGLEPDMRWPESVEPLREVFAASEPYLPLSRDGYVFVRLPQGPECPGCAVGVRAEHGRVLSVAYAVPGSSAEEPPAGLEGYQWRDGWWTVLADAQTGALSI